DTHVGDGRGLLSYRDVDADQLLALLVDDRVHRYRRLAGLAVANDELPLTAAYRHHGVDRLQARLHRLRHRFSPNHPGRDFLYRVGELARHRTLSVDRLSERVHHAAEQFRPHRNREHPAPARPGAALPDVLLLAEHHRADRVALEVEREPEGIVRKLEHFALHDVRKPVHPADTVGHGHYRALGADVRRERQA